MFSGLEVATRGLMTDPTWNWVFKNTFDAMEEQLNKVLFAIAALVILVRFISNLASGDLLCIVNDVTGNETELNIVSLAGPFHQSLSAYAAQNPICR